jgi:hypothetical protein
MDHLALCEINSFQGIHCAVADYTPLDNHASWVEMLVNQYHVNRSND